MPSEPIVVLGMHRSGTSVAAGLLRELGVHFGDESDLLPPDVLDNPDGYFEHARFVEINNALLAAMGGSWAHPPNLTGRWERSGAVQRLLPQAKALVATLQKQPPWGWKDPRTCLTLPFWLRLTPNARFLWVVRHPVEVAMSMSARHEGYVTRQRAIDLWIQYNRSVFERFNPERTLVVGHESVLADPAQAIDRMTEFFRLKPTLEARARAVHSVRGRPPKSDELLHAASSGLEMEEALELYASLAALSPMSDPQSHAVTEQLLKDALDRIAVLEQTCDYRAQQVEALFATPGFRPLLAVRARLGRIKRALLGVGTPAHRSERA